MSGVIRGCAISDDDCLGGMDLYVFGEGDIPLCQFHGRTLYDLGQEAFAEWYSIELSASATEARQQHDREGGGDQ